MKAIQLHGYGFEHLRFDEVLTPQAGPGQVLVRVRATSVNSLDWYIGSGAVQQFFPVAFPWTPGGDFAGTVEAVGDGVTSLVAGTDVYGTMGTGAHGYGGAYAEYVVVPAAAISAKPATLSFAEAASVPVVALTAWQALTRCAHVQAGQTVLIHGGAGAVGAYAVQFAHQLGAKVIATAAAQDLDFVRSLGADEALNYKGQPFEAVISPVDMVFDLVGGTVQQRSYAVLKAEGYLVAANQPPDAAEAARHGVHASMFNMQASGDDLAGFAQQFAAGTLRVDLARTYPLAQAGLAWADSARHHPQSGAASPHAMLATTPKTHGKIVLEVG